MSDHSECVAEFDSVWLADRAVAVLAEAGIEAVVDNRLLAETHDPHLTPAFDGVRVLVLEPDAERARAVLRERPEPQPPLGGGRVRCLSCGQEMAEEQDTCPACGWSYLEGAAPAGGG